MIPSAAETRVLARIARVAGVSALKAWNWRLARTVAQVDQVWTSGVERYGREAMERLRHELQCAHARGEI